MTPEAHVAALWTASLLLAALAVVGLVGGLAAVLGVAADIHDDIHGGEW